VTVIHSRRCDQVSLVRNLPVQDPAILDWERAARCFRHRAEPRDLPARPPAHIEPPPRRFPVVWSIGVNVLKLDSIEAMPIPRPVPRTSVRNYYRPPQPSTRAGDTPAPQQAQGVWARQR
jgi:hypothetical protein